MADLDLSVRDRVVLQEELARIFNTPERAEALLNSVGLSRARLPLFRGSSEGYWREMILLLDYGTFEDGYRLLIDAVMRMYPFNETFRRIAARYAPEVISEPSAPTATTSAGDSDSGNPAWLDDAGADCHVAIVRDQEGHEDEAIRLMAAAGLSPLLMWSSARMDLYRVRTGDTARLRAVLDQAPTDWTVFPPGTRPGLLAQLLVQGPDGRTFRLSDVPATTTVADIATAIVAEYGPLPSRPFAADLIGDDDVGQRLSPSATLHEAGVRDGSRLRVGFQATAGAINPALRQEALQRARAQILAFATANSDVGVHSDDERFPTVYEIEFNAASFGPPAQPEGEPVAIDHHLVQIVLGADYPLIAPVVFWLTPIFHPNIYPVYDCELARQRPHLRGLVCLDQLSEAYRPDLDLGQLCQILRDLARYRNYSLVTRADTRDTAGSPEPVWRNNAFDLAAAHWAMAHQERIVAIGGRAWPDRPSSATPSSSFSSRIERLAP